MQGDDIVRELLHDFDTVSQPYHSAQEDVSLCASSIESSSPTRRLPSLRDSHSPHPHGRTAGLAASTLSPPPSFRSAHLFADLDPSMESFEAPQRRHHAHQEPQGMVAMSRMNARGAAHLLRTPLDPVAEQGPEVLGNAKAGSPLHGREKQPPFAELMESFSGSESESDPREPTEQ